VSAAAVWLLPVALLLGGCNIGCWFVPCDRVWVITGHVLDLNGRPVKGATIELHGIRVESCDDGCFSFTTSSAASDSEFVVDKEGYRRYASRSFFGDCDVTIRLAPDSGTTASDATCRKIKRGAWTSCASAVCK
jgi:hypothetical protein